MTTISKEDVLKIAAMSNITVHERELEPLAKQLAAVLSYAERVKEIGAGVQEIQIENVNIMREDLITRTPSQPILAQAPSREEHYFVVPAIIEHK